MVSANDLVYYGILTPFLVLILVVVVAVAWYFRLHRELAHLGRRMGARWWDAAGPMMLGGGVVAVAVLRGDVPADGESGRWLFVGSSAVVLVGVIGATLALGNLDEHRQLSVDADAAGIVDDGPVVLSGTARPHEGTVTPPLSGDPALCYTLRVTEPRGIVHRKTHVQVGSGREERVFALGDGTGSVLVDPADARLRLWKRDQLSPDEVASPDIDRIRPTEAERIEGASGLPPGSGRRFEEMRLRPGDDVTVLGTAHRDPAVSDPVVRDGDRRLVVFRGALDDVRRRVWNRVRVGAALAVVGLTAGAFGIFRSVGVL